MNGEIICVGTELLLGNIVNTNARFLSEELAALGINVYSQSVVGDNESRIRQTLRSALCRSDVIIMTGGLGPTDDDMTKESVAAELSVSLIEDEESKKHIDEYFHRTERFAAAENYKQALMPEGSHIFKNDIGTAPGCAVKQGKTTVIILPGPPLEMEYMFKNYVRPYLLKSTNCTIVSHNIRIFGEMESQIDEKIRSFTRLSNPTTAIYASEGEVSLRVTAKAESAVIADNLCAPVMDALTETVGDSVYGTDCDTLQGVVVKKLKEKNLKVATAESCTAGLLSSMITEVAGSSSVFDFGISAYANRVKINTLGVPQAVIEQYGAVSEHTAAHMANGVRQISGADIGIGITGVAGPAASENKPVGLVYVALADSENTWVRKMTLGHGNSEREKVRRNSAKTALDLLRRYLFSMPEVMEGGFENGTAPQVLHTQPKIAKPEVPTNVPSADVNTEEKTQVASLNESVNENAPPLLQSGCADFVYSDTVDTRHKSKKAHRHGMTTGYAKKENPKFIYFLSYFFPWKDDSVREIIRKLIFVISLLALVVSSVYIIRYFNESKSQAEVINDIRDTYAQTASIAEKDINGAFISFSEIVSRNGDTRAWLNISSANIDNPVVQANDNSYYLSHNFNGDKSRYGTLYFDASAHISAEGTSQNLVIYGHEMRDGTMFGSLKKYKNLNFCKENPVFGMRTLYDDAKYKIFAVFITNASPEQDNGKVFEYRTADFADQNAFLSFAEQVRQRSIINTGVDVVAGDKTVTLSTCTGEFDDARLVIVARRVRDGEDPTVDATRISVNATPRYPQAYYDKKGIENPFADAPEIIYEDTIPTVDGEDGSYITPPENTATDSTEGVTDSASSLPVDGGSAKTPDGTINESSTESLNYGTVTDETIGDSIPNFGTSANTKNSDIQNP